MCVCIYDKYIFFKLINNNKLKIYNYKNKDILIVNVVY